MNDNAQLAIFFPFFNNQFEVTEEFLCVKTMQGRTTAMDVYEQLCDAIEHAGESWKNNNRRCTINDQHISKLLILDHYRWKDAFGQINYTLEIYLL